MNAERGPRARRRVTRERLFAEHLLAGGKTGNGHFLVQQMRRDQLIEWRSGVATILRRDLLVSIADYRLEAPRSYGLG